MTDPRLNPYWRVAIVVGATILLWLFVYNVPIALLGSGYRLSTNAVLAVMLCGLTVPMVVLARRFLDRQPWAGLGLPLFRVGWRRLLFGMACWLIPAGLGFALCIGFGWTQITVDVPLGGLLLLTAARIVLVFLYEALPEELVFRGYVYRNLATALPRLAAVAGQAALFTLTGMAVGVVTSPQRVLIFFTFGIVLGIFRAVTGDIWAGIGFHLAFQTVAQLVLGAGDAAGDPLVTVTGIGTLQTVAFAILPFGLGVLLLETFYRQRPAWKMREESLDVADAHYDRARREEARDEDV